MSLRELLARVAARPLVPDPATRRQLLDALTHVLALRGSGPFLDAPLVLPEARDFPDPWWPLPGGVGRLAQRLLQHAGLGHLGAWVQVRALQPCPALYLGTEDGLCRFAVLAEALEEPEALVAALTHEVALAAAERLSPADNHLEALAVAAGVHHGLGVLLAAPSPDPVHPVAEASFLLAAQLVLRPVQGRARRAVLRCLGATASACVREALRLLEPIADPLGHQLGLPARRTVARTPGGRQPGPGPLLATPVVQAPSLPAPDLWPIDDLYDDELTVVERRPALATPLAWSGDLIDPTGPIARRRWPASARNSSGTHDRRRPRELARRLLKTGS